MKKSFAFGWLALALAAAACVAWIEAGQAYVRRSAFGVPPIPEASRTSSEFVAILLPRITAEPRKFAMSAADLAALLGGLKADGFASIGLDDVAEFYAGRRLLPPKALLIAFVEDDPQGLALADGVLRGLRLRGAVFLSRTAAPQDGAERRALTRHAVDQLRRGGAWSFGWISQETPPEVPEAGDVRAVLDDDGRKPRPRRAAAYPLRFVASDMGLDDASSDPRALQALALRGDSGPDENRRIVAGALPRTAAWSDDFRPQGLGADWVGGWGVASRGGGRMALVPTPRQSGAGVFLRGTDRWRDASIEFELKRYQKEFWAYARYRPDGGYVRVGARGGSWYVEQKSGPRALTSQLARAPIPEGGLPARVRIVLKGDAILVHVNGRMEFGRALRLHPAVERGRVLFGVYDGRSRSARAVLTSVRAAPLDEEWLAPKRGATRGFDEQRLGELREEAVFASVLSPRWIQVGSDGAVAVDESQAVLVRSLAGFYGCRLVPMAELSADGPFALADASRAARALSGLSGAARGLDAGGLNLRLRGEDAERPETLAFLARLREALRARRQRLWVTLDGGGEPGAALRSSVDGVLRPAERKWAGLEILEAARPQTAASPRTAGRTQRETASIQ